MAGSPFSRILRDTHLERRSRRLLGMSLFVVISVGFIWYGGQDAKLIMQQDRIRAHLLVDSIMLQTHWPVWAPHENLKEMLKGQSDALQDQKYSWKFLKANSTDFESQQLDAYERSVLEEFLASPLVATLPTDDPGRFRERELPEQMRYEYYQPIYAKEDLCVHCHRKSVGQPNLAKDDLIAVVQVQLSNEATQREQTKNRAILIAVQLVTAATAIAVSFAILRYVIFKPLQRWQDPKGEIR